MDCLECGRLISDALPRGGAGRDLEFGLGELKKGRSSK